MKIAVYSDVFGGKMANGVVVSIIKLVKGLADKGHKIYLVVSKNEDNVKFRYKNVKIIEAPSIPAFFPTLRFASPYNPKIRKNGCDLSFNSHDTGY